MGFNLSIFITVILVAIRKPILNKLNINNKIVNIAYFTIIFVLATLLNMYKVSFSTMNDSIATDIIKQLTIKHNATNISEVYFGRQYFNTKPYNIRANIEINEKLYEIFIKANCRLIKGCSVDKYVIIDKEFINANRGLNYSRSNRDVDNNSLLTLDEEALFSKKSCADLSIINMMTQGVRNKAKEEKIQIELLNISNYAILDKPFSSRALKDGFKYTNSCKATISFKVNDIRINKDLFYDIYVNYDKDAIVNYKY